MSAKQPAGYCAGMSTAEQQRDELAAILDQLLAAGVWSERLTIQPVPWDARTVDVARGVIEVADLDRWSARYLAIVEEAGISL